MGEREERSNTGRARALRMQRVKRIAFGALTLAAVIITGKWLGGKRSPSRGQGF